MEEILHPLGSLEPSILFVIVLLFNLVLHKTTLEDNLYLMLVFKMLSMVIFIEQQSRHIAVTGMSLFYCCRIFSAVTRYAWSWTTLAVRGICVELFVVLFFGVLWLASWSILYYFHMLLAGAAVFDHLLTTGYWASISYLCLFIVLFFAIWRFFCGIFEEKMQELLWGQGKVAVKWVQSQIARIFFVFCFSAIGSFAFTHMLVGAWLLLFCRSNFYPDMFSLLGVEGMKGFLRLNVTDTIDIFSVGIYESITSGWGIERSLEFLYFAKNSQIANNTVLVEHFTIKI